MGGDALRYADVTLKKDPEVIKLAAQLNLKDVEKALQYAEEGKDPGFNPIPRWASALLVLLFVGLIAPFMTCVLSSRMARETGLQERRAESGVELIHIV